jgi:hypothetical protein
MNIGTKLIGLVGIVVVALAAMPLLSCTPGTREGVTSREIRHEFSSQASPTLVSTADLLAKAEALRGDGRFREAEITLTLAIQTEGDNLPAWRLLATVLREMSAASIKAGNLLSAARAADRAAATAKGIAGISVNPASPGVDPKIVVDEEKATEEAYAAVRDAIDTVAKKLIEDANTCAEDAHHSWAKVFTIFGKVRNERPKVVEGLKCLKKVFDLGPWASEKTRCSTNEIYCKLKTLVSPDEWQGLLAQAGFDPASADTLKMRGLEK